MIAAIAGEVSATEAERIVSAEAIGAATRAQRKLYYPYFRLELRHAAETFLGKTSLRVSCLVDARTRLGATTDPFPVEPVEAAERDVLSPRVGEREARRVARRYAGYVLRNRRRAWITPTFDVLSCELVYKPFWIVTGELAHEPIRVLVDGVTGGFYPLAPADVAAR